MPKIHINRHTNRHNRNDLLFSFVLLFVVSYINPIAVAWLSTQQYITETQFDIMSLQEFKSYVENSGVDFDGLTNAEKREWRETFDKSRGKLYSYVILSYLSTPLN